MGAVAPRLGTVFGANEINGLKNFYSGFVKEWRGLRQRAVIEASRNLESSACRCTPVVYQLKEWAQFHPELKSKPFAPHPLFADFVRAAVEGVRLV